MDWKIWIGLENGKFVLFYSFKPLEGLQNVNFMNKRFRKTHTSFVNSVTHMFFCVKCYVLVYCYVYCIFFVNLELRMQEMVSMGIGSKPFMDIKPSDAAISDRAIDYIMKGSGELFLFTISLCLCKLLTTQSFRIVHSRFCLLNIPEIFEVSTFISGPYIFCRPLQY